MDRQGQIDKDRDKDIFYHRMAARTCDAIKLGILTPKQRPVWLEAYAMYPPLDNPVWNAEEDLVTDITESK